MRILQRCIFFAAATLAASTAMAAPGDYDPAYGTAGRVLVKRGTSPNIPYGITAQADGKYLVPYSTEGTFGRDNGLLRYNADHTLDTSWGYQGQAGGFRGGIMRGVALNEGLAYVAHQSPFAGSDATYNVVYDGAFVARYTTAGVPDPSFGIGGSTPLFYAGTSNINGPQSFNAVAIAPDGKIVAAGYTNVSLQDRQVLVARFNPNGMLDTSFGPGGKGWIVFATGTPDGNEAKAIAIQPDGAIVVVGTYGFNVSGFVTRVTSTGALDATFGNSGTFHLAAASPVSYDCQSVLLDGARIILGCSRSTGGIKDAYVLGLTAFGTVDFGFDSSPKDLGGSEDGVMGMAKLPDGRILVSGRGGSGHFALLALNANGTTDTSFASNGVYIAPETESSYARGAVWNGSAIVAVGSRIAASGDDVVTAAFTTSGARSAVNNLDPSSKINHFRVRALQGGKALVGGTSKVNNQLRMALSRFNADGTPDGTFGTGGHSDIAVPTFGPNGLRDIALQADGKVVLTGDLTGYANELRLGAVRALANGGLDPSFNATGTPGYNFTSVGFGSSFTRNVRLQADGKIVVTSRSTLTAPGQIAVARFNVDGTLDGGYGASGVAFTNFASTTQPRHVELDSAGRAVVAGEYSGANQIRIARFTTGGILDSTFGSGGMTQHPLPAGLSNRLVNKINALPGGKILITFSPASATHDFFCLMQLLANGSLDTAFGSGGFATAQVGILNSANAFDTLITPSGRIVVSGHSSQDNITDRGTLVRFMANGTLDGSFGTGGIRHYTDPQGSQVFYGIDMLPDGSMLIAGDFQPASLTLGLVAKTLSDATARGQTDDFNADNKPDLIWSNTSSGATYIWRMNGLSLQSDSLLATIDPVWKVQGVGDFNSDGHPDVVWRNTLDGNTYVWYLINGVFQSDAFLFSLPPEWVIQGVADFNADGKPDFLMRNVNSGNAFVWFFNNNVAIGDQFLFNIDPSWKVEGVGDFNQDGQPDLLFRNMGSGLAFAWNTQYAAGTLSLGASSPSIFSIDAAWEVVQVADWNNDGRPDLLFRNAGSGLVFVWYMNGTTLTTSDFIIQIDPSWEIVPRR